ncbi:MAG: DUF1573 domain-containing protein [Paramuribaculum sp.]|nr:DUF1573 domain-containing protein [Paramuribaculum sp.]
MKRYIPAIFCLLFASLLASADSAIRFDRTSFDLGTIHASKGQVKATYNFTNTGDTPLVIISVSNGGCGCTKPEYPKQPIQPGKSGTITINFNPAGRKGELNREVKVKTNAPASKKMALKFSGVILP